MCLMVIIVDLVHLSCATERPDISILPITFITYLDANLFQPSLNDTEETTAPSTYVDSHVLTVTVELDDVIIRDLPQNSSVLINFSTPVSCHVR